MRVSQCFQMVVACVAIVVSGCASNEMVRKEEAVNPTAAPVATAKETNKILESGASEKSATTPVNNNDNTKRGGNDLAASTDKLNELSKGLNKIYFDYDSSDLSKEAKETLSNNASILMKQGKTVQIKIEGNCDERGSAEYNLALGERRAKAAAQYLRALGVSAERISTISYGKERPAVQGNDEATLAINRRDEFVIIK